MKFSCYQALLACFLFSLLTDRLYASSQSIELRTLLGHQIINEHMFVLDEHYARFSVVDAIKAYEQRRYEKNADARVSFGFKDAPLWLAISFYHEDDSPFPLRIKLNSGWLDRADVYLVREGEVKAAYTVGDKLEDHKFGGWRLPLVTTTIPPGESLLLFKISSDDPMTVPIYLLDEDLEDEQNILSAYFYGFLYGAFLILLVYNFAIYLSLKEKGYLLYSLYLFFFFVWNFAYTGHGFRLLWPESVFIQEWIMPVLMYCYVFSGVLFTVEFLQLKQYHPSFYQAKSSIYSLLLGIPVAILIYGDKTLAVIVALFMVSTLSLWMLFIGLLALKRGNKLVHFFLPAVMMGAGGATISGAATWGLIPYSAVTFHFVEIGMVFEMSLLAMALSYQIRKEHDARLDAENTARLDPLTGLYNRRAFPDLAVPSWELGHRNNESMSLMLMDLDHFKEINDKHGHEAGDKVLVEVARILKGKIRKSDIAARWGGEEFLIFLPNTNSKKANQLAELIRKRLASIVIAGDEHVTVSIGVVCSSEQMNDLEKLINIADQALYQAKEGGRNQVIHVPVDHVLP